ncbi:MAG: hypothetical protein K0S71_309 [Clostridia bacterium]|jgi:CRISPR/Cas system-associated exonuclease Cas4 (RecB family)|nr:hypothetical protein [Clostridia bacterium]
MSLVNKEGAKALKAQVLGDIDVRGFELSGAIYKHFSQLHEIDYYPVKNIEELLLRQKEYEVSQIGVWADVPKGLVRFSPSGASKCERELYYKAIKAPQDIQTMYPFQRRWTRNASAIHEAVQTDLLYAEYLLKDPSFKVARMNNGLPAWEKNLQTCKTLKHNGIEFALLGMMDGVLWYTKDGSKVGFEFKTKSTTIGAVGNFKMKDAQDSHKEQCVAYSILFGMDEFILMYESLAKDNWNKGADAKLDFRTFYLKVTEDDRNALLNKFSKIAKAVKENETPAGDFDKCLFCPYKTVCSKQEEDIA